MAALIRSYKGYKVKKHTPRDNSSYPYGVYNKDNEIEWEADTEMECYKWIDGEVADRE